MSQLGPIPSDPDRPAPRDFILAHQFLYYVRSQPIWSDHDYDRYCARHHIQGGGGSDLKDHYPPHIQILALRMAAEPDKFLP
jgi:hypothetical protein